MKKKFSFNISSHFKFRGYPILTWGQVDEFGGLP